MKTEQDIIEEMKKDPHWKLPDPENLGFYGNDIVEDEAKKFMAEVKRRLKIQKTKELETYRRKTNQFYFVTHYLDEERKKLMKHYREDIHGRENFKSFEKAESLGYALNLLYAMNDKLQKKHTNVLDIVDKEVQRMIDTRCPKCDGPVYDSGPDGEQESYECMVCEHYFLKGPAVRYSKDDF